MVEFSCADYAFPLLSRVQIFQLLRVLEFEWIDIGLFEPNSRFLPSEIMTSPTGFTRGVLEDLESAGLHAADVFLQIGLIWVIHLLTTPTSQSAPRTARCSLAHWSSAMLSVVDI